MKNRLKNRLSHLQKKRVVSMLLIAVMLLTSLTVTAEIPTETPLTEDLSTEEAAVAAEDEVDDNEDEEEAPVIPEGSRNPGDNSKPRDWNIFREILEDGSGAGAGIMSGATRDDLYQHYFREHEGKAKPDIEIEILMADYNEVRNNQELNEPPVYEVKSHDGEGDCLVWDNDLGEFDYVFNVPKSGIYNLEFLYQPTAGKNNAIEISLLLNGEYPFSATRQLELDKFWQNEGVIDKDSRDNELLPRQKLYKTWINYRVKDKEGLFNEPYFFYLEEGENTITVEGIKVNGAAFKSMTFKNYPDLSPYEAPSQSAIDGTPALGGEKNEIKSNTILLQGQTPYYRTSTELVPSYDNGTYLVSPSHAVKMRYNTVGGGGTESWSKAGQTLVWEFSVPQDGYYRFSAKFKQNMLRGFSANRRVLINGEVPFKEFDSVKFAYGARWQQQSFTTDTSNSNAEDAYVFLKASDNPQTIALEVVPGEIGETVQRLEADLFMLNYYFRRILMITGPNPDEFNPYYVDKQIPELIPEFIRIRDRLREEKAKVEELTGSRGGSEASTLETMAVILDRCIANPDRIPLMQQALKDNIGALSAWIRQASRQPLEIDYIEVMTVHEKPGTARPSFWRQILFLWNGFIGSFFEDFTRLDDGSGINVWVGLGRDQALCLKHLVDSDFNVNYDTPVSINLVQGSILEASLAGKGPEVALFIGGDFPVQLAARNMTVDITQFPDYKEIVEDRFVHSLPTFFTYLGGVYGLPLSQAFPMMFYRTDILEDLDLAPPLDWDEFTDAVAVLNRAYLEIGLVSPTSNLTSTIFEPGETFALLQLQTGNNFYVEGVEGIEDHSKTTFDQESSIEAFTRWTRFYTVYQFEQTYDPFTRFRTGEMPIVIQGYGFFNMVSAAAPEIRGLWDFRHVPGTWRELPDGMRFEDINEAHRRVRLTEDEKEVHEFLDISASSAASCGLIFNKTKDKEAAWEFLKWLTSDEIQTQFGQNMEAMLGPLGRYDTANKNALANLAWSTRELRRLEQQRDAIIEIPMIPSNYSATRHIKNAFRAVVNDNWFPRYALESYNRDINQEIERKNAELASHQGTR
jgi:ABC-type glycerol-3-phosphate transport system substrate-binding protein